MYYHAAPEFLNLVNHILDHYNWNGLGKGKIWMNNKRTAKETFKYLGQNRKLV